MRKVSNIELARRNCGYTQEDLAKALGVSRVSVSYWERGRGVPKAGNLQKMAQLLGVPMEDLMKG